MITVCLSSSVHGGWLGEAKVSYLTSLGCPTDIGLQLGKDCYPCSRLGWRGNVFIYSVSSLSFIFIP